MAATQNTYCPMLPWESWKQWSRQALCSPGWMYSAHSLLKPIRDCLLGLSSGVPHADQVGLAHAAHSLQGWTDYAWSWSRLAQGWCGTRTSTRSPEWPLLLWAVPTCQTSSAYHMQRVGLWGWGWPWIWPMSCMFDSPLLCDTVAPSSN